MEEEIEHNAIVIDGITFGAGWNCCTERPAKTLAFDGGARWAVCSACVSYGVALDRIGVLPAETLAEYRRRAAL